jgi:NAD(P)H-flavin reductase
MLRAAELVYVSAPHLKPLLMSTQEDPFFTTIVDPSPSAGRRRNIGLVDAAAQAAAGQTRRRLQRPPWYEKPTKLGIGLIFLALALGQTFPFFFAMSEGSIWDMVFDLREGKGLAVMLGATSLLAAVAGAKAHGQKRAICSFRVIFWLVHALNIVPLGYCLPWWWKGSLAKSEWGELMEAWAYISGVMCQWNMGLCLLPLARESAWLNSASVAYPEGIPFHRLTGWWCIAQTVIHSAAEMAAVMAENYEGYSVSLQRPKYPSTASEYNTTRMQAAWNAVPVFIFPWVERLNDETGVPELNTEGLLNFLGLVGTVSSLVLGVYSLPMVRRRAYEWFYRVHVPLSAGFIVMGALHSVPMQFFIIPGITALLIDRTDLLGRTASSRSHRVAAKATVMTDGWLRLDLQMGCTELRTEGAAGTQWVYMRVPGVSGEWHPFSLAAHGPSVIIKGVGDWSKALHKLAVTTASAGAQPGVAGAGSNTKRQLVSQLSVEIDGAYGQQSPPWQSFSHILLIGGGVGVAPWLPLMDSGGGAVSGLGETQRCSLIFTCRNEEEYQAMQPYLPSGQRTKVFLTRSMCRETEIQNLAGSESEPDGPGVRSAEEAQRALPAVTIVGGGGSALLLAVVGVGTMLITYLLYELVIEKPEEDGDEGVMGGGGNDGSGSTSDTPPPAPDGWKPTTLWSYFLIKTCVPVFGSFISMMLLMVITRWCKRKLGNFELACPMRTALSLPPSVVGTAQELSERWQHSQQSNLAIPSLGAWRGVSLGRPDLKALVAAAVADAEGAEERRRARREALGRRTRSGSSRGLFVCVCGPAGMVHSTRQAVREAQAGSKVPIGFHAEASVW